MPDQPTRPRNPHSWIQAPLHGAINAVAWLAVLLTLGLLAFSPLPGLGGAALGIAAAFATVIGGGLVYALAGRTASPVASASSATAVVLAALIARLLQDPGVAATGAGGVSAVLACAAVSVGLMGLMQIAGGLLGAGSIGMYVPQPVLAGFKNGVALLILISQLPPLLGLPALTRLLDGDALAQAHPAATALGLGTAAVVWGVARWRPRAPAALVGLMAGVAAFVAARWFWPQASFGPPLGELAGRLVWPDALLPLATQSARDLLQRHAADIAQTAAVMAVIGSLESMLAAIAIDRSTRSRHDPRREMLALGAGNIASALCGGLPLVLSRARSMLLIKSGAMGRRPVLWSVLAFVGLFAAAAPLLQWLPRAVLAGIMLTIAWALVDDWTWQLLRRWLRGSSGSPAALNQSLAMVAAVWIVTVWFGFVAAVLVGLLLSMLVFIFRMNRGLVRSRGSAALHPSRRIHLPAQEAVLQTARQRVLVLQLEGALFFGSAERLLLEVDWLPPDCPCVVLDFKRIGSIDESGAVALQSLWQRLRLQGVRLLLAGVMPDNALGTTLLAYHCLDDGQAQDCCPDLDRAVEAAEALLLAEVGTAVPRHALLLADAPLLGGLSALQRERVLACMPAQPLAAGALLFHQGDAADRLYVLTEGSVSIIRRDTVPDQRYVSFPPGMVFGETAMLDGGGRTADAVADTASVVHELTLADFDRLSAADPALGAALSRNVARHLSERLRSAAVAWQAAGG
ncbi:MAG: SulP family inorganic anion transporter [Rubrivivax sp.]